mgnify:FL=1
MLTETVNAPAGRARATAAGGGEEGRAALSRPQLTLTPHCRKAKCSGDVPSCESCLISHEDCSYSGEHDGRKPASKQYLKALQERVKALEALLDGEAISHVGIETVEDITAGGGARVGIGKARKAGGTDGEALPEDLERLKVCTAGAVKQKRPNRDR